MTAPDLAAELKRDRVLSDPRRLLSALNLLDKATQRQAAGFLIRCPWHADSGPSCSVQNRGGIVLAHCFSCDHKGDALDLVAVVHGLDSHADFRAVMLVAAELAARHDLVDQLQGRTAEPRSAPEPRTAPEPTPERTFPPQGEVLDMIASCRPTATDVQVATWLASRKLSASDVDIRALAYALPPSASLPSWARCSGQSWLETGHRLIVPIRDHAGDVRSVRAGRIVEGESPKRLTPAGHTCRGLVMADAMAQELLRGGAWPSWSHATNQVLILEGEPDWLTWAIRTPLYRTPPRAVFGIISGSWTPEIAARIPDGSQVVVRTHHDQAGEKYAAAIAELLGERCTCLRGGRE